MGKVIRIEKCGDCPRMTYSASQEFCLETMKDVIEDQLHIDCPLEDEKQPEQEGEG